MSKARFLLISIFFISLGLRLVLSIINRQANDDHMEVINWIVDKHEIPKKENCWECFQPKLFYVMHAGIIKALHIENKVGRLICVQLINFLFSFFILFFLWRFIERQNFSPHVKISSFALVAFNPCLLGINIQATNDTLEILAGVLSIYFAGNFFMNKKAKNGIMMILFAVLASIIKGSGLVIVITLILIFLLKIYSAHSGERKWLVKTFCIFILGCLTIIPFAGGYYQNFQTYKEPFVTNQRVKNPPPLFFERTYFERPGITSIADGYLTFRYADLIRLPYINNGDEDYPLHRTSLWSQLYGRTLFIHFDQWPYSWQSTDQKIIIAGRVLMLLGIFPLLIFLAGFFNSIVQTFRQLQKEKRNFFSAQNDWIYLAFLSAFFAFIIKYTYDYRDFSTMKSIFLFPVLPAFIKIFMEGFSLLKSKQYKLFMLIVIFVIVALSIYDISFLIHQLIFIK